MWGGARRAFVLREFGEQPREEQRLADDAVVWQVQRALEVVVNAQVGRDARELRRLEQLAAHAERAQTRVLPLQRVHAVEIVGEQQAAHALHRCRPPRNKHQTQ